MWQLEAENWHHAPETIDAVFERHIRRAEHTRCNLFFGYAPRLGSDSKYNEAWQIRRMPAVHADVDAYPTVDAAGRVEKAGSPPPPADMASWGTGSHLYWVFESPLAIDDLPAPQPIWEMSVR